MEPTTTISTLITPAPYLRKELLVRRGDVTCGDLQGSYTNVQAPVCTGQTSICTFSNAQQGCCDDSGNCQFYTTCNGPYNQQASCTDSNCLSCPHSSAFCVKYNFWDSSAQQGYDGYGCGTFPVDQTTIYGVAASVGADATSTFTSSRESSSSTTRTSSTPTSASPTNTSTSAPVSKSHVGAIAGGVVGGVAGAALLLLGAMWYFRRRRPYSPVPSTGGGRARPQQHWRDGDDHTMTSMSMSEPYGR